MPFITVRDIQMYYEVHGRGPRLLFFNGSGGDLRSRPGIFESILSEHFEILAHDQRGLGQTDRPDIPYSMADYAMDADALVGALGWDSFSVFGVSFGGMVAQEFAVSYPDGVERLVLACSSAGGAGGAQYPIQELDNLEPRERAARLVSLQDTRRDATWQTANPREFQELVDQVVSAVVIGADEPGRAAGARCQLEARAGHNTYDRLPGIQMPLFICGGRYDGIAPVANQQSILKQVPHARLEQFEGGHGFLGQDPKAPERVLAFLKGKLDGSA